MTPRQNRPRALKTRWCTCFVRVRSANGSKLYPVVARIACSSHFWFPLRLARGRDHIMLNWKPAKRPPRDTQSPPWKTWRKCRTPKKRKKKKKTEDGNPIKSTLWTARRRVAFIGYVVGRKTVKRVDGGGGCIKSLKRGRHAKCVVSRLWWGLLIQSGIQNKLNKLQMSSVWIWIHYNIHSTRAHESGAYFDPPPPGSVICVL